MKQVLLIDDDPNFLTVLKYVFQKEGYKVVCCSSGEKALDLIESNDFGAIISDYKMGRVSGLTIARTAKNKKPPIPIVLLTAYAGGFWNSTWGNFPDKVFPKPVDFRALAATIAELKQSHREKVGQ